MNVYGQPPLFGAYPYDTEMRSWIPMEDRIYTDRDVLVATVDDLRSYGAKIVLTSGSFDLTHLNHGFYAENAASNGGFLVVGVDSDEKVSKRKGPSRPIIPEMDRARAISASRRVDFVTIKQVAEPRWNLIKQIRPDVLVVTEQTYSIEEMAELQQYVGSVVIMPPQPGVSTSARLAEIAARGHTVEDYLADPE